MKANQYFVMIMLTLFIIICAFKFRIQMVAVPVFINLNSDKYIILKQDTLSIAADCGIPIKKIYYIEKL